MIYFKLCNTCSNCLQYLQSHKSVLLPVKTKNKTVKRVIINMNLKHLCDLSFFTSNFLDLAFGFFFFFLVLFLIEEHKKMRYQLFLFC